MTEEYLVRTFVEGDEEAIVQLFEKANMNYGGYTQKTPEYWRWCCRNRPDVEQEGVLLAFEQKSKELVGYVVAGKSGTLWELSYDPEKDGVEIVSLLLDKVMNYLAIAEAPSIGFTAPQKDTIIKQVCEERGFTCNEAPKMFLGVLNINGLISLLANNKVNELTTRFDEAISVKIENAPSWINDTLFLQITRNGIVVENEPREPTIQLQTDYLTLSSLLVGNITSFDAFIHSKLKIKPLSKILTALKLLSHLNIGAEWSFQLSEYG
jgi:hypothetical protein